MANLTLTHDFDKLVKAFETAPHKTKEMVRLQVKMATRDIAKYARGHHGFITRSGALERAVSTEVKNNEGLVYLDSDIASHGIFIHQGTKAHTIEPRNKLALRWVSGSDFAFAKRAEVNGIKTDPFLYDAAEAMEPEIQTRFENALEALIDEVIR